MKLIVAEPESTDLRAHLRRRRPLVSSALARTEVLRAVSPAGEAAVSRGRSVLSRLDLLRINDRVLEAAGILEPVDLRSLDAIHLATAQLFGADLSQLITYDDRMADAARRLGFKTVAPR